ncbi:MAG: hypothetical protein HQ556_11645 [Candidatus Marinimicrobia bacterium]|nr:hypothetical protein [Candidatus Neomarinimicrobiota bacterium]
MSKIPSFLSLLLILATITGYSQWKIVDSSADKKPEWVNEAPKGQVFRYYSGMGSSNTSLQHAQENAVSSILQQLVEEGTFNVSIESTTETSETIQTTSGIPEFEISDDFIREVIRTGTSKAIRGLRKEEEFWQSVKTGQGLEYQYWVLFKIPKPGLNPDTIIMQGYGFAPVWRSVLLPGWGQRYKGERHKGSRLLISTASAGAATFVSFYMSDSYTQKAETERDIDNRNFYNDWSNRSYTIGILSGLLTSGIYGYNIFDALTAPGAKKYASTLPVKDSDLLACYDGTSTQVTLKFYF